MWFEVGEKITAHEATPSFHMWCQRWLILANPDYIKKDRMGLWTGSTPRQIYLYEQVGSDVILPTGCLAGIRRTFPDARLVDHRVGGDPYAYGSNISLYGYQEEAVKAAVEKGGGIMVAPCGAGKTQMGLEVVARIGVRTLWLTHTEDLLNQSMARAQAVFSCPTSSYGKITGGKVKIGSGITFATVQTMSKLDLPKYKDEWGCVVVDECFPGDILIDSPGGTVKLQNLRIGDIVTSYNRNNKRTESKRIIHIFKNKAHNIVKIKLTNGENIVCTANHPIFTKKEMWISAGRLTNNDYVLRAVREGNRNGYVTNHIKIQGFKERILFLLKSVFRKRCAQKRVDRRTQDGGIKNNGCYEQEICQRTHEEEQPYEKKRDSRKGFNAFEGNRASTQNQMWKWSRTDSSTANIYACSGKQGIKHLRRISNTNNGKKKFRLSDLLQGGYRNTGDDDCNRSGWKFSFKNRASETGQEERRVFEWIRVAGVEVQKQTSDGTFGGLCPDGYVYNIEVEDNNNYFVNGILVHNCHHCVGSPTRVMQFYKVLNNLNASHKYGLTATPKRADGLESAMFSLLGGIAYEVPREAVADTTCSVRVKTVRTGWMPSNAAFMGDGTVNYSALVQDLVDDKKRTDVILDLITSLPNDEPVLILGCRVGHLMRMCKEMVEAGYQCQCISGAGTSKLAKDERKAALGALDRGDIHFLFATYQLAKEGLDCPNLRHVVLATPEKDPTTIQQAAGRVGRKADGKAVGTVWDVIDDFGMYLGWAKKRIAVYKKLGYEYDGI